MNKGDSKDNNKEAANLSTHLRIKDHQSHFLGEVQGGMLRLYCKRCKEFFEVPISQLVAKNLEG